MTRAFVTALAALVLLGACAPTSTSPTAPLAAATSSAEFRPGFRVKPGSMLRYQRESLVSGTVPGISVPQAPAEWRTITFEVLSLDPQGISNTRMDVDGKPFALLRYRANGQLVESQPLSREASETVQTMSASLRGITWDRPIRVGDSVPFRERLPKIAGLDRGADFVGTAILSGFSTTGRCRTADFQGSMRLDSPRPLEVVDQKTGRRVRWNITGTIQTRQEVETAALLEWQTALKLDASDVSGAALGSITLSIGLKLDPTSFGFIGCG